MTSERKSICVDGVYDIETEKWDTFVIGGLLTKDGFSAWDWRREDDMVDSLLSKTGRFYAHNGGCYDALWFIDKIRKRGLRATCYGQGQRITSLKVGGLTLCDSFALVPMSLAKGSQIGNIAKRETGLTCICGEKCGGYCAISRKISSANLEKLKDYLHSDCLATMDMLDSLSKFAGENDIDLCNTIGGSSWTTAKRWLNLTSANWSWGANVRGTAALYAIARKAYFGGRTQVFKPEASSGWRYDINSSYPAALSKLSLPVGGGREVSGSSAAAHYNSGKDGLFGIRIHVPEQHIPPLPIRGDLRLIYPWGTLDGYWTANEIQYAETLGARIQWFDDGLVWDSSEMVFAPLCRQLWALRHKVGPKTALGTWLKWLANSLTGRLAIRPEMETIIVDGDARQIFCPARWECENGRLHGQSKSQCCEHICTGKCGTLMPLGLTGHNSGVFVRPRWQLSDSAHIHWAAYLTAHARIELHKQLCDYGNDDGWSAVYCDTDSCYSESNRIKNIGEGLGEWKPEGGFRDFVALAPKTYSYVDGAGQRDARSKGITDATKNWDSIRNGDAVAMERGVMGLRSALRSHDRCFVRKHVTRRVLSTRDDDGVTWYGDRWLGEDGFTHAVEV